MCSVCGVIFRDYDLPGIFLPVPRHGIKSFVELPMVGMMAGKARLGRTYCCPAKISIDVKELPSNICLVGEIPTCSAPALEGREGVWWYDNGHA